VPCNSPYPLVTMTNTKNPQSCHKVEIVYTDQDGNKFVLASNTFFPYEGMRWEESFDQTMIPTLPWAVLRGIGYLCLKAACTKLPVDPDSTPAVAAVAAYRNTKPPYDGSGALRIDLDGSKKHQAKSNGSLPLVSVDRKIVGGEDLAVSDPIERWVEIQDGKVVGRIRTPWPEKTPTGLLMDLHFMADVGKMVDDRAEVSVLLPLEIFKRCRDSRVPSGDTVLDCFNLDVRGRGILAGETSPPEFFGVHVEVNGGRRRIMFVAGTPSGK